RRVHGGDDVLGEPRVLDRLPAVLGHLEAPAEQRLCRGGAEGHEDSWGDETELPVEPGPAGGDLGGVRLVVDAPLAARLPLEVLDRVRHVHLLAVDAGRFERLVEHAAGGTDERMTCEVLLVTGLLTDEHHLRAHETFTEHRLCCVAPEVAAATVVHCTTQSA